MRRAFRGRVMEKVQGYLSKDGSLNFSEDAAYKADALFDLDKWINDTGMGSGGDWDSGMIKTEIIEGAGKLHDILKRFVNGMS